MVERSPVRPVWARAEIWLGALLLVVVVALYSSRMATSFTSGDTADYLNSASTGALSERGNGVPLYITLLNLAVRFPLPFALSDGIRCNLLSVFMAATATVLTYAVSWRLTRSIAAAAMSGVALMVTGNVWGNAVWIMPHVGLALISALFLHALFGFSEHKSVRSAWLLGLVPGLGYGFLPTALLLLPGALAYPLLRRDGRRRLKCAAWVLTAFGVGVLFNAALIAWHEHWQPVQTTSDSSLFDTVFFYIRGGEESGWFLRNLTLTQALRGLVTMPLRIGAEFEIIGFLLALLGVARGIRRRPSYHLVLIATLLITAVWVGVYPGDTRTLHGIGAFPIAAVWVGIGTKSVVEQLREASWWRKLLPLRTTTGVSALTGLLILSAFLVNIAAGHLSYRRALCDRDNWYLAPFCSERVPERIGDAYLKRTADALRQVPPGAVLFGMMWDSTDQLNHLIQVKNRRPDLQPARDLTKFSTEEFSALVQPLWHDETPVFLYGEWRDIEVYLPEFLEVFRAVRKGDFIFRLYSRHDDGTQTGGGADEGNAATDDEGPQGGD